MTQALQHGHGHTPIRMLDGHRDPEHSICRRKVDSLSTKLPVLQARSCAGSGSSSTPNTRRRLRSSACSISHANTDIYTAVHRYEKVGFKDWTVFSALKGSACAPVIRTLRWHLAQKVQPALTPQRPRMSPNLFHASEFSQTISYDCSSTRHRPQRRTDSESPHSWQIPRQGFKCRYHGKGYILVLNHGGCASTMVMMSTAIVPFWRVY